MCVYTLTIFYRDRDLPWTYNRVKKAPVETPPPASAASTPLPSPVLFESEDSLLLEAQPTSEQEIETQPPAVPTVTDGQTPPPAPAQAEVAQTPPPAAATPTPPLAGARAFHCASRVEIKFDRKKLHFYYMVSGADAQTPPPAAATPTPPLAPAQEEVAQTPPPATATPTPPLAPAKEEDAPTPPLAPAKEEDAPIPPRKKRRIPRLCPVPECAGKQFANIWNHIFQYHKREGTYTGKFNCTQCKGLVGTSQGVSTGQASTHKVAKQFAVLYFIQTSS